MVSSSNKILLAGILGFAAGILYAPRKGSETQEKIKNHMHEMKNDIEDKAKRAKSKLEHIKKDKDEERFEKAGRKIDETIDHLVP